MMVSLNGVIQPMVGRVLEPDTKSNYRAIMKGQIKSL